MRTLIRPLASLRLTVALLAMTMVIVFTGTLAQTQLGIWDVTHQYFRAWLVWIPFSVFDLSGGSTSKIGFPFPGGYTLGALLMVNLLAAHTIRFKFRPKRIGMIMTHSGLIVLIAGEFVTGFTAVEGNMTIDEGASSNFVEDIRSIELAIVAPMNDTHERVVVVPQSAVSKRQDVIRDPRLPFEIRIDRWMPNSRILREGRPPPGVERGALRGFATNLSAEDAPVISGVDSNGINAPSVYITLMRDGASMGTWLLSAYLNAEQTVRLPDESVRIALRYKRTYKPYTLHLIDFSHDRFTGTNIPRNYSSRVRLVDPGANEDREVLIWMNHPLRHGGDTLYQASFKQGDTGTILQVVTNPGWLLPYVSCALVSLGLIIHFAVRMGDSARRALR